MKVRVPKEQRPPTRFGIITKVHPGDIGGPFRVKSYRLPRKGEWFWDWLFGRATTAEFDFKVAHCVILEEVTG